MYGLHYFFEKALLSLPLLSVHVDASIKELAAQVNLTQTYRNDALFPIEAKYSFPIPVRAAVSSFAMIKEDGTRVVGSVLEKFEARKTYDTAILQGQQASLMEQQTPDVFQIALGNIPPKEQVRIELIYSTELGEDEDSDSVRFHLPVHIGARYGDSPENFAPVPSSSSSPFLTISATVEAIAPIFDIESPSHEVTTKLGPDPVLPTSKDLPASHYARVSLTSDAALDKDFILTFKSTGLDAPRCIAEQHPTNDTTALALSFVPRFTLPDLERQEFILLVDRSGSMEGARIAAARKALVVLLRSLPHKDTLFQVASFGWEATSLWPKGSRPYDAATLEEATKHVDGMQANYGGTEMRGALEHVFAGRAKDRPTSVLVLTDGEAWDLEGVLATVKRAVEGAPDRASLRVSVLGIGDGVSTAMCEGIARVGRGSAMYVGEQEKSFAGKVARLVKAARTPSLSNITVDWGRCLPDESVKVDVAATENAGEIGDDEKMQENKTLNVFNVEVDPTLLDDKAPPPAPPVILPPPAPVQQSPFKIHNLFPGSRINIYAILQGQTVPDTVILRGSGPDGSVIELPVPVTLSRLPNAPGAPPPLHALAARKIIQDLEDGQYDPREISGGAAKDSTDAYVVDRTIRAHIVRLGTTYQITSVHTSFVAVDESREWRPRYVRPLTPESDDEDELATADVVMHDELDAGPALFSHGRSAQKSFNAYSRGRAPQPQAAAYHVKDTFIGRVLQKVSPYKQNKLVVKHSKSLVNGGFMAAPQAVQSPSTLDKLMGRIGFAGYFKSASPGTPPPPPPSSDEATEAALEPADVLEALARLQSFDGAFASPAAVLTHVPLREGTALEDVRAAIGALFDGKEVKDDLLASVLAMTFMARKMNPEAAEQTADSEAWAAMYEKARMWVESTLTELGTVRVGQVQEKVAGMLLLD